MSTMSQEPTSLNKTTPTETFTTDILMSIAIAVIFSVIIMMIVQSHYMQAFGLPTLYSVFGIVFILSKVSLVIKYRKSISTIFSLIILLLLILGTYLIMNSDIDTAKLGVYALIAAHLVDTGYMLYSKYYSKIDYCPTSLWGAVIGNAGIVFVLIYSLM